MSRGASSGLISAGKLMGPTVENASYISRYHRLPLAAFPAIQIPRSPLSSQARFGAARGLYIGSVLQGYHLVAGVCDARHGSQSFVDVNGLTIHGADLALLR